MIHGGLVRVLMALVIAVKLSGAILCDFDDGHEHLIASHGEVLSSSEHHDVHNRTIDSLLNLDLTPPSDADCEGHDDAAFMAEPSTKPLIQFLRAGSLLGLPASDGMKAGHNAAVAIFGPSELQIFPPLGPTSFVLRV